MNLEKFRVGYTIIVDPWNGMNVVVISFYSFFLFFFFDGKIFVSFLSSDLISFFLFSSNKFDGCARYG